MSRGSRGIGPVPEGISEGMADFLGQLRRFAVEVQAGRLAIGSGGSSGSGSGSSVVVIGGGGGGGDYEPDLTPPPTPTGVVVLAGITSVIFRTADPTFTQGHGHLATLVFGQKYGGSGPLPTFDADTKQMEFSGLAGALASDPSTQWHFWLKWKSRDGVESVDPAGGLNGFEVTTGEDVTLLLEALTGQIRRSELHEALGEVVDLIDADESVPGSVNARILTESTARVELDDAVSELYTVRAVASAGGRTVVGGFGLAGTASNAEGPRIDFGVRANTFFVDAPDGSDVEDSLVPFVVRTTVSDENGVEIPAGVYMDAAYMVNLTAMYARIALLVADDISTASLFAVDATIGTIKGTFEIRSTTWTAGPSGSGYRLTPTLIELPATAVRGKITAEQFDGRGAHIQTLDGRTVLDAGGVVPLLSVGGVNLMWGAGVGPWEASAAEADKVVWLKTASANWFSLLAGESLTVSADLYQDAASAAAAHSATLVLWCEDVSGAWTRVASATTAATVATRKAATLLLPITASMVRVGVALYHPDGAGTRVGKVFAERIQVERGVSASQFKPGTQPGATVGAPAGTYVGGTLAQDLETMAEDALADAGTALTTKLEKAGTDILSGEVRLTSTFAFWFGGSGVAGGANGVYIGANGIVGRQGGVTTFAVDAYGNAVFGGALAAATGTFAGALSAATGTFLGTLRVGSSPVVSGSSMTGAGAVVNNTGTFALGTAARNLSFDGTTLTMNGDLIVTGNIVNDAVSTVAASSPSGTASGGAIASVVHAIVGGKVLVMAGGNCANTNTNVISSAVAQVTRNGTVIREVPIGTLIGYNSDPGAGTGKDSKNFALTVVDTPGAGTHTYALVTTGWGGSEYTAHYIASMEIKR